MAFLPNNSSFLQLWLQGSSGNAVFSLKLPPYKISFDYGTKVAVVTQYRISYYFHATVSFNCGTKVAVVTRYQLPNYFHITTYPLTPLHKSSPPPSAVQFLLLYKPIIEVTKVTESQNSNYIHITCHVWKILTQFCPL